MLYARTMERTGVADKVISNLVSRKLADDDLETSPSTSFSVSRLNGPPLKLHISNEKHEERCTKLELRSLIGIKSLSNCISNNTLRKINSAIKTNQSSFQVCLRIIRIGMLLLANTSRPLMNYNLSFIKRMTDQQMTSTLQMFQ